MSILFFPACGGENGEAVTYIYSGNAILFKKYSPLILHSPLSILHLITGVTFLNNYSFKQLSIGQTESFGTEITEEKMQLFCRLTGDVSPIHLSDATAAKRGFSGRVVYGMLCAGLFSTLAGVYLPGESCLLHSVETKFLKPVFIGDALTISGTVTEKNEAFNTITIKALITNQNGEKVTKAVIKAGVYSHG
jgi:acyl dehydratase